MRRCVVVLHGWTSLRRGVVRVRRLLRICQYGTSVQLLRTQAGVSRRCQLQSLAGSVVGRARAHGESALLSRARCCMDSQDMGGRKLFVEVKLEERLMTNRHSLASLKRPSDVQTGLAKSGARFAARRRETRAKSRASCSFTGCRHESCGITRIDIRVRRSKRGLQVRAGKGEKDTWSRKGAEGGSKSRGIV